MALRSRLDVVAAWRPIGDLHRLAAVGTGRADGSSQCSAMGSDGHGKKRAPLSGAELGVGGVAPLQLLQLLHLLQLASHRLMWRLLEHIPFSLNR
jgi:hypothetical protein